MPYVGGRVMRRRLRKAGFINADTARRIISTIGDVASKGRKIYSKYKEYVDPALSFGTKMLSTYAKRNQIDPSSILGVKQEPNSGRTYAADNMNRLPVAPKMYTNPASNEQKPKTTSQILRNKKQSYIKYRKPKAYVRKYGGGSELMRGPIA